MKLIFGPQREPMVVPDDCELRDYGFSADFGGPKKPDSAIAAGTDRENAAMELARGPQGEILEPHPPIPPTEPCPLCGQEFPEACSEDGGQVSDPTQSLRKALADYWDWEDPDDDDDEDLARRENIMTLFRAARLTRCSS